MTNYFDYLLCLSTMSTYFVDPGIKSHDIAVIQDRVTQQRSWLVAMTVCTASASSAKDQVQHHPLLIFERGISSLCLRHASTYSKSSAGRLSRGYNS